MRSHPGSFGGIAGHNKRNVQIDGRDGSSHIHTRIHIHTHTYTHTLMHTHTRCQSAEECFAVLELIDALISWPFIPTFRLTRRRSGPPRSSEPRCTILPRSAPAIPPVRIEYFLSAKSRKMTLRYFERFSNLTSRLFPSVRPQYVISRDNHVPRRILFNMHRVKRYLSMLLATMLA